ncbi:hypothetical protein CIPAW_14G066200 [Carya illinoinensis]|uniref:Uncharacterized protein n=1 Tax=Carya illinoinensis TaxID=32201 RepID=A0A8T1NHI1_CARIL|nr:hypothetical protein CIPAW_14G066200 [Carya illinoinensis]
MLGNLGFLIWLAIAMLSSWECIKPRHSQIHVLSKFSKTALARDGGRQKESFNLVVEMVASRWCLAGSGQQQWDSGARLKVNGWDHLSHNASNPKFLADLRLQPSECASHKLQVTPVKMLRLENLGTRPGTKYVDSVPFLESDGNPTKFT